ncbi:heavy metal translocating P-type ATPase [Pontibacillus litoralis]|uniref:Cd(2+)-exporting ATPase n=1 Tax=Pontibacillus litoralis JSM 072002 TaxID=1385512 RepID=A0A0A5G0F1_9BACI|nr:heavy metal translocating P-type ATPase [Pontibacillus litoralis]KGX86581.1 cadmium transporter [Pontibacillus litoralis JSM 072002]
MSESTARQTERNEYRIEGFSCAGCAKTFENNVKQLQGVQDAQVNFGASKLTVYGQTTIENLEKAGEFERLSVRPAHQKKANAIKEPFLKRYWKEIMAAVLIIGGYTSSITRGEADYVTVILFIAAIFTAGITLFRTGLRNLVRLEFDMRTLMTIAIIGAAIIGEWGEAAVVVVLFAISEALEKYSMNKARSSIQSLMDIAPSEATVRRNGNDITIPVEDIKINDVLLVKPGQKIAMDGVIETGSSFLNEAAITGESVPVEKTIGEEVFAGTLNTEGYLEVTVTKTAEDTTLAKIIHLVEEAQAERAPSQQFVDTFAKYYTPAIIVVAFLVAIIPPLFGGAWSEWVYQGLAVLVVGCPCALVISTPVSIVTAIGNAAKNGILIKGGVHLEEASRIQAIAFDKTGTLTQGTPQVTDIEVFENDKKTVLSKIASLEAMSQHPLAKAIMHEAQQQEVHNVPVENFTSITGKGLQGDIDGMTYYVGSPALFTDYLSIDLATPIVRFINAKQQQGKTVIVAGTADTIEAAVAIRDELRSSVPTMMKALHKLNIKDTMMLTGDNEKTAQALGKEADIATVKAELLPQQKYDIVKGYDGKIAMVGDGINDAPALASASVGIAMGGGGTDTALETADIALMADDLNKIPYTISLSKKALRIIKQNISFSLIVKLAALLLVIPGWLTLWIAIFADMGATLLVTLNGLRLLKHKE